MIELSEREKERQRQIEEVYRRGGLGSFGRWGNADVHPRYTKPIDPPSRRKCHCGCERRATHLGMANGVALNFGCEWSMAKWARGDHPGEDNG